MEAGQESNTVSEQQAYEVLNFHPLEIIEDIRSWLDNKSSNPLVLRGKRGIGRNYVLSAACYQQEFSKRPYKVIALDMSLFSGDENIGNTIKSLEKQFVFSDKEKNQWGDLVKDILENTDLQIVGAYSLTTTLTLAVALKVYQPFSNLFKKRQIKLPSLDSKMLLQEIIEVAAQDNNIVLHIQNSASNPHNLSLWQDIAQTLDYAAINEDYHGRVMVAISLEDDASISDSLGNNSEMVEIIDLKPYTLKSLRIMLSERYKNNNFDNDFLKLVMFQEIMVERGKSSLSNRLIKKVFNDTDQTVFPSQLVNAFQKLNERKVLQYTEGGWQLDKSAKGSINTALGMPLREYYQERFNTIPESLQGIVKEYMFLASLCGKWMLKRPLLEVIGVEDFENQNEVINAIEEAFVDCVPPLLEGDIPIYPESKELGYQLTHPLLSIHLQSGFDSRYIQDSANTIIDKIQEVLPVNHNVVAELFWRLASLTDEQKKEEWREYLHWHVDLDAMPYFKSWVKEKIDLGLVTPSQLMLQATNIPLSPMAHHYLDSVVEACESYYQKHRGFPITQELALSLNKVAFLYHEFGQYEQAIKQEEKALKIFKIIFLDAHQTTATSINNLGLYYGNTGKYKEALEHHEKSLKMRRELFPEENLEVAQSLSNIGAAYHGLGEYKKSLDYAGRALATRRILVNDSGILNSLGNIGSTYHQIGEYEKSLEYKKEVLERIRSSSSVNQSTLALNLDDIGVTYHQVGEIKKALECQEEALVIKKTIYSNTSPTIARSMNGIGSTYHQMGEYSKALKYKEEALEIRRNLRPINQIELAQSLHDVGATYYQQGRYEESLEYQESALKIRREHSSNQEYIAYSLNSIGTTYCEIDKYEKALKYQEEALSIWVRLSTSQNEYNIGLSFHGIGSIYVKTGNYQKALKYLEKALIIRKSRLSENQSDIAYTLQNIGSVYYNMGKYNKSIKYTKEALEIRRNLPYPIESEIIPCLLNLGAIYNKIHDYKHRCSYLNTQ